MQTILSFLTDTFGKLGAQFLSISFNDIVDIALLAVVLYYVYRFVRERRAGKLALGLAILVVFYALTAIFEMHAMSFLLQNVFQVGLLALIILFQPELRAALEKVGGDPLRSIRNLTEPKEVAETTRAIDNICIAASDMARDRTGALIVIERTTKLGDIMKTGVQVDAVISQSLIKNIFFNKAALHDGAMIIRDNRIAAAGCFLPLTQNTQISKDKGTRHRAGVGVSEVSDAVVIIVSEETGEISLALGGSLLGGQNYTTLRQQLTQLLFGDTRRKGKKDKKDKKKRAAAAAAAIAGESDPSVPVNGAVLAGFSGLSASYDDTQVDTLVTGGVTPLECVSGEVSIVRGITTRTTTGGAADKTWRELTTVRIVDDVIPALRASLRARFVRSKNTAQVRAAIRSQVMVELENKRAQEIIDSFGEVSVKASEDDPTVCLVEFSFAVAHGLNRIYLSAHITV